MNARELALDIFLESEKTGSFAGTLIRDAMDKYDYEDGREKAFFKRLAEGTLERRITLDWAIDSCSKMPISKMKPLIRSLLRLSAYQILYMEAVPDSAACNEAVKLAKKRGFASLSGFVNGVLRSLSRNKEGMAFPDPEKAPVKSLSVRYSLPEWLAALWIEQYGRKKAQTLGEGTQKGRPVTIRFRSDMTSKEREGALERMRAAGVGTAPHPLYDGAYVLENCEGVASLFGFAQGLFYVQDVSSMLAVEAAGIRPGMRVLDLCSAPGGKAMLAYEKLGLPRENAGAHGPAGAMGGPIQEKASPLGALKAGDLSRAKTDRIWENADRMGCRDMEICVWDARTFMPNLEGWADVVLADVPCSGLGVLGRKKDIRYRVQPSDLEALTALQKEILTASWKYVRPGGVLLYSTCTVNRTENEEMVRFLTESFPFETESLNEYLPEQLCSAQTEDGMLQLFTGEHDTDGFFMARLRRRQARQT